MSITIDHIKKLDPEVAEAIKKDLYRQKYTIQLIASENYTHEAILEAQGCIMTNKYAEGLPGKRYYGGCEFVDIVENLAIERAKKLFNAEYANVQPHSGTQANLSVYFAVLQAGQKIMGMSLDQGGHLSHGAKVSASGKIYNSVYYGVSKKDERIDYDEVQTIAKKEKPQIIIAGASSYPREIDFKAFKDIAEEVNAYLMADIAHIAGLVAANVHQSPVPYADFVTSTTQKTLRGPRGGFILCKEKYGKLIDKAVFPGNQGGPLMHVIAAKAICFKLAMEDEFKEYARQIVKNSRYMAKVFMDNGFRLVTDGTDNHLFLVDLRDKGITGKEAEEILYKAGIVVNKNAIPYDPLPPYIASGIRIGTPSITARGMKEKDVEKIANIIIEILNDIHNENLINQARKKVKEICEEFPIYKDIEI
ncbi:MAG: serine hydroxymethyltransferase [Candidatus Altarchaeaceae archaeon]